jgi:UDP-N-acetylmuramoyl-tripeptide--D-alanyl-D-alanine ligase
VPRLTLADLVRATQGALVGGRLDATTRGVSIDSRTVTPGEVFFAIRGHRQDGHAFVGEAVRRGAAAVVVTHLPAGLAVGPKLSVVVVDDTTHALQRLAAAHRRRFAIPVVAITGSNGKTTTKELTARVLERRLRILRAAGSFNNQWGLPLTLLELGPEHEAAVVELGMNAFGEIAALAAIAQPTVGVVTSIGPAHLEFLGSLEGVQKAKGELVQAIPPDGLVILNADDPLVAALGRDARSRLVTYGRTGIADVRLGEVRTSPGGLDFSVTADGLSVEVPLPLPGLHNAWNAAAAIAVGRALGIPLAEAADALREAPAIKGRLVWREAAGVRILDDTYNANPASLRAALDVLRDAGPAGRAWVVLGDMLELGGASESAHREAGGWVAAVPAAGLAAVGPAAGLAAASARLAGCADVAACETPEEAARWVAARVAAGDRVLVKGSRGMQMERGVAALLAVLEARSPC